MDDAEARRDFQRRFERMGRVFDEGPPPPGQLTVEDCARENAEHEARGEHVVARPSPERLCDLRRRLRARGMSP